MRCELEGFRRVIRRSSKISSCPSWTRNALVSITVYVRADCRVFAIQAHEFEETATCKSLSRNSKILRVVELANHSRGQIHTTIRKSVNLHTHAHYRNLQSLADVGSHIGAFGI